MQKSAMCRVVLLVLVGCCEQQVGMTGPPQEKTPATDEKAATIEELAPHASGICLAEVVDIAQHDERAGDGNLYDLIKLKMLRQSGLVNDTIIVVKKYGGLRPPGAGRSRSPSLFCQVT